MEDWYTYFLREVLQARHGRIDRFNHRYAARTAFPGCRTLEIGPGNGTHLDFEDLDAQDEYVAIELRPSLSDQIGTLHPKLRVVVGDCQKGLPFPDGYFDRVLAIHVLEHLDDLPAVLGEISRVLKWSGTLSVVLPCEGGRAYALGRRLTSQRQFERRYGTPYNWMISYDHINTAREVIEALSDRFSLSQSAYFPLRIKLLDCNLVVGLTFGGANPATGRTRTQTAR
jgi:SAM-dependent methyltransferase